MTQESEQKSVVIIEDDLDIRVLLEVILTGAGFHPQSASTGAEGIAAVRGGDPDLVVVDVGLPDSDGFSVVRSIREITDAAVVIVSARDDDADVALGLEAGANAYLAKPFRPRELRARIDELMRSPLARQPVERGIGEPAGSGFTNQAPPTR